MGKKKVIISGGNHRLALQQVVDRQAGAIKQKKTLSSDDLLDKVRSVNQVGDHMKLKMF